MISHVILVAQNGICAPPEGFATTVIELDRAISAFHPRAEGSRGEKEVIEFITTTLSEGDIDYTTSDFSGMTGAHSFSQSISAFLRGHLPDELIIVAPLNHSEEAISGKDGSLNLALALALALHLKEIVLPVSLRFLFLGAELGEEPSYPMGSQQFLDSFFPEAPSVALYLFYEDFPVRTLIRTGDRNHVSPYWLTERCSSAMDNAGHYYLVRGNENQFYRLGITENPAPILPYLANDYPALSLHGSEGVLPMEERGRWSESFFNFISGFVYAGEGGFPTAWDRHYLFFQAKSFSLIIREGIYIILIIVVLVAMVLYPLAFPDRIKRYTRSVARSFWFLPFLLALVFGLLILGTLFVDAIARIKGSPDGWQSRAFPFFALKISTAIFVFALMYRFIRRIPFPRRGRFYSSAALLVLFLDILILGAGNISLAYYTVWACIWTFLFTLFRWRWAKIVCILVSPFWFLKAAYDVFTLPAFEVAEQMLLSRISGNLVITFVLFPFLLLLIRIDFMFRHPTQKTRRIFISAVFSVLGVICVGLSTYLLFYSPYSQDNPQPVVVTEEMDFSRNEASIVVQGSGRLGAIEISGPYADLDFSTKERQYASPMRMDPSLLTTEESIVKFLGRKRITVTIEPIGIPTIIGFTIRSSEEIVIYDSNFPFSFQEPKHATIHIGRYPPVPLIVEFTIPESQRGSSEISVRYSNPPTDLILRGRNISFGREMILRDSFRLEG